jgi:DNA-directed RNA polymerase beta' subunit
MKISNAMLKIIIDMIHTRYKLSLAPPGLAVGIIASQSLHEMYTQFMLDAHLRAGVGGTDTADKLRGIEIMVARETSSMKNPKMLLYLKPEFEHDKKRAQVIANNIESFKFKTFINTDKNLENDNSESNYYGKYFGGEAFGNHTHELLQPSKAYFERMKKYMNASAPSELSSYVIKFEINMRQMVLKDMGIQTIINALKIYNDKIFVVYGSEMDEEPAIFCYIKSGAFKTNAVKIDYLKSIEKLIINTPVRGVDNIKSARVKEFQKSVIMPDGSISFDTVYTIATLGTNLLGIMCISELDITKCQSDSVHEMESVFGISAGRRKLITEIMGSFDGPAAVHATIFVSEMIFTGSITGITKKGAGLRQNDVLPLASYTQPIQVLSNAAINGRINNINCPNSALILGAEITSIGTSSSIVVIDDDAKNASIEDFL